MGGGGAFKKHVPQVIQKQLKHDLDLETRDTKTAGLQKYEKNVGDDCCERTTQNQDDGWEKTINPIVIPNCLPL